jgi:hypothetical protein
MSAQTRNRCGMPCLTHPHDCDRSPGHTGVHRDVQQKGDHSCEWDTPGPQDVPTLLAALEKSRRASKELGKAVVFLTELMKDAFQQGGTDPIGALHMIGNHLAEALVPYEDAEKFDRAFRALETKQHELREIESERDRLVVQHALNVASARSGGQQP